MKVIAYDVYENPDLKDFVTYVSFDKLLSDSDLISLHCPLTNESMHIINSDTIDKMKDGVILVNTSRGALIKTEDLIDGIRDNKFHAVGLDVYEEEGDFVFDELHCDNPRCITSTEQEIVHTFRCVNRENGIYRCIYCEAKKIKE